MRQLRFNKPPAEDVSYLLAIWSSLGSSGTQLNEPSIHQSLVNNQGRFVISVARQYQGPELGIEALLEVAHSALVAFLNQIGNRPEVIDLYLAHTLRDAMIKLSHSTSSST